MQRTLFICSAVENCQEQSNCCPHKQPHIRDERCIPKLCRYGPRDQEVDCVLADPVNPHVPKAKPEPVKLTTCEEPVEGKKPESVMPAEEPVKKPEEVTLIHEPEEKKPEPAQRPVTLRKNPSRKAAK